MRKIRVLMADDHSVLRESLKSALEFDENIDIIAEAEDGNQAYEKAELLKPDVILMDINMPFLDGIAASDKIKKAFPEIKILILTMHENKQYIMSALAAGIDGYILKMSNLKKVMLAIHKIAQGESYFDSEITEKLASWNLANEGKIPVEEILSKYGIVGIEQNVFNSIINGLSLQEISANLGIDKDIIKNYHSQILKKLSLQNTASLILFAVKEGILKN